MSAIEEIQKLIQAFFAPDFWAIAARLEGVNLRFDQVGKQFNLMKRQQKEALTGKLTL